MRFTSACSARRSTSSRSFAKSGKSRCAWVSISIGHCRMFNSVAPARSFTRSFPFVSLGAWQLYSAKCEIWGGRETKLNRKVRMQTITPFLWFDDQAEDAVKFYTSIFSDSKIGRILRYTDEAAETSGRPVGSVLTIEFEIAGQKFVVLNGGPQFKFSEAVSFVVNC